MAVYVDGMENGARQEPEWLAAIPMYERRTDMASLLYGLSPLVCIPLYLYKPPPFWAHFLLLQFILPSAWMVQQWCLRRYRPEIAFKTWDKDDQLRKRVFRLESIVSIVMILWLVGTILLVARGMKFTEVNLLMFPVLLINPAIRDYVKDHKPHRAYRYNGWIKEELKPLQSEHWGETPVSRA